MTTIIKVKCPSCGLHFAVYSWSTDWKPRFCPECGGTKFLLTWREQSDLQIYEHVPGMTQHDAV